jgi:hypothetical protein
LLGEIMARENKFQANLIKELKTLFPDSLVLKNDANARQGIPDLLVLHGDKWAALECKRGPGESHQPNQDYYVDVLDDMSYAAFIFPENKEVILDELQSALRPTGKARNSKR